MAQLNIDIPFDEEDQLYRINKSPLKKASREIFKVERVRNEPS